MDVNMKIKTGYPFCYGSHLLAMIIAAVVPSVGITVKAGDIIFVPCRWCVIGKDLNGNGKFDPGEDGAPAFTNPGGVTDTHGNPEPDTDNVLWRRHERASDNIWIPGAGISFRSAVTAAIRDDGHFPIIADPVISPGSQY